MKSKNSFLWIILFMVVFLLSQDYLFISREGTPSVLGFPAWIGWFAFVHILFIAAFYLFAKKYWNE